MFDDIRALEAEQQDAGTSAWANWTTASPEYQQIGGSLPSRAGGIHAARWLQHRIAASARCSTGLGFQQRRLAAAHGGVFGRLADAHRAGETAAGKAEPAAAGRADQSPGSGSAQLAGSVSDELSERLRADLARPLFSGRDGSTIAEIWNKRVYFYSGGYSKY